MARSTLLNTDTEDLKELLSNGKSYRVPHYQRDYSWKAEHWEDLWEDLLTIEASREDHYMGALVLESMPNPSIAPRRNCSNSPIGPRRRSPGGNGTWQKLPKPFGR